MKNTLYLSVYNEDAFEGCMVPMEWKEKLDNLGLFEEKLSVFDNYAELKEFEVECASEAREGSYGIQEFESDEWDAFHKDILSRFETNS